MFRDFRGFSQAFKEFQRVSEGFEGGGYMFAVCGFWPFFARLFAVSRFLGPFFAVLRFRETAAVCGFWPYLHAVLRFQVILFAVLRYQCILFCDFIDLTYIHL